MRITAWEKLKAVREVVESKKVVTRVAREWGIPRRSLYRWVGRYKTAPKRAKQLSLQSKYARGEEHPRAAPAAVRTRVKRLAAAHPEWGSRKVSRELGKKGIKFGYGGVYEYLVKLGANTPESRERWARSFAGPGRVTAEIKLEAVKRVTDEGMGVGEACTIYSIPRRSLYHWLSRYQEMTAKGIAGTAIFDEGYVSGTAHPRAVSHEVEGRLLSLVATHPEYSVHKLTRELPVSIWTVQKLLTKNKLNLLAQRAEYAKRV